MKVVFSVLVVEVERVREDSVLVYCYDLPAMRAISVPRLHRIGSWVETMRLRDVSALQLPPSGLGVCGALRRCVV